MGKTMKSSVGCAAGLVPTESSQGKDGLQQEAEAGGSEWGHAQLFPSRAGTRARRGGAAPDRSAGLLTAGGGAAGIQGALPRRS